MAGTPAADIQIDIDLVSSLLAEQCPDLATLPLSALESGWDNDLFRLGETLLVRLPRREVAAELIRHEQVWLPRLAANLSLPVPVPIHVGQPSPLYPWSWSLLPWLEGKPADLAPPDPSEAPRLAKFLRQLHQPAPKDAPQNPVRGVPLADRAAGLEERLNRLEPVLGSQMAGLRTLWQAALEAPVSDHALWMHGDLHSRNVLVQDGKLSAIIDWGDLTAGDVATDLAATWMLFEDADARTALLAAYGADTALIARAKGWAVIISAALVETGMVDHPRHAEMGFRAFNRLLADG